MRKEVTDTTCVKTDINADIDADMNADMAGDLRKLSVLLFTAMLVMLSLSASLLLSSRDSIAADNTELDKILNEEFNKSQKILANETKSYVDPLVENLREINSTLSTISFTPKRMNKILSIGEFIEVPVSVENLNDFPVFITFSMNPDIQSMVSFDDSGFSRSSGEIALSEKGSSGSTKTILLIARYNSNLTPKIYSGYILFSVRKYSGSNAIYESYKYPVNIELLKARTSEVELNIDAINENNVADSLKVQVDATNYMSSRLESRLTLTLQDFSTGKNIFDREYSITFDKQYSDLISLEMPDKVQSGKYILTGRLRYPLRGNYSESVSIISFDMKRHVLSLRFLGLPLWIYGLMLVFAGLVVFSVFMIREYKEKQRRYHLPITLSTLPLLKSPDRIFLGKLSEYDKSIYFDMDNLSTHTIVAGSTGGGKTVAAQDIVEEALNKKIGVVVFDPTAQWTGFFRKNTEKKMIPFFAKFGMRASDARSYPGKILVISDPLEKINLERHLIPGEITVFSLHKLTPKEIDLFVASTVKQVFSLGLDESSTLKYLLVYDEVHRLLPKFGGTGAGFVQIERAAREFRKWGLGLVLISQVLSDFIGEIKANINTEIQLRTKDEGDLERLKNKYGEEVLKSVVKAETGNGMLVNPAYNKGKPFMVNFRPLLHSPHRLSEADLGKYVKYSESIDEIDYNVSIMKSKSADVFDLELELKLAKEKLSSGSFTMVEIYLEGLNARLSETLAKNNLPRQKVHLEKVDIDELKEDVRLAEETRQNG